MQWMITCHGETPEQGSSYCLARDLAHAMGLITQVWGADSAIELGRLALVEATQQPRSRLIRVSFTINIASDAPDGDTWEISLEQIEPGQWFGSQKGVDGKDF